MTKTNQAKLDALQKEQERLAAQEIAKAQKKQQLENKKAEQTFGEKAQSLTKTYETLVNKADLQALINRKQLRQKAADLGVWDSGQEQAGGEAAVQGARTKQHQAAATRDTGLQSAKADKLLAEESTRQAAENQAQAARQKAQNAVNTFKAQLQKQEEQDKQKQAAAIKAAQKVKEAQAAKVKKEQEASAKAAAAAAAKAQKAATALKTAKQKTELTQYTGYVKALTDQWKGRKLSSAQLWQLLNEYEIARPSADQTVRDARLAAVSSAYVQAANAKLRTGSIDQAAYLKLIAELEGYQTQSHSPKPSAKVKAPHPSGAPANAQLR